MNDLELPPVERDAFYAMVWKIARQIPSGRVYTYGQIAALIPTPGGVAPEEYKSYHARWAGNAMAACPVDVPWQRVINAQGKISLRRGAELQRAMLEAENISFDDQDRIDLAQFGWRGPDDDWLESNGLNTPGGQLSLF